MEFNSQKSNGSKPPFIWSGSTPHPIWNEFIPPHILRNLARAGIEEARYSIQQSRLTRLRRAEKILDIDIFRGKGTPGTSHRKIYDSQGTFKQRVKLVRDEGSPVSTDESVNQSYDYAGEILKYFKEILGRNSMDNLGMDMVINVHFGEKYINAFWDGDDISLGDGDGEIFLNFSRSLDVIAHELSHGVTQYTANFKYKGQSGALHEHFSDAFASAITQYALKQTAEDADWLIGNEIMGPELYGESIRSMREPGTAYDNNLMGKDIQPAHMKDYYTGTVDHHGVHINSGIPNKAFYLVSKEIETDTAALIWYNALQKLWPNANFNDAMIKIVEATRELIKAGKAPQGSTQIVRKSFKDVGLLK